MIEIEPIERRIVGHSKKTGNPIKKMFFKFKCEYCGEMFERTRTKGKSAKSCRDCSMNLLNPAKKSGMSGKPIYAVWQTMKQRCDNDNNPKYPRYGGRGITYDPRWSEFENFYTDMKDGYKNGLTIDRKDNDGNYTKDNCRWISGSENSSRSKLKKVYKLKKKISYVIEAEYESGNEAEYNSGIKSTVISDVIAGRRGSAGGFEWVNESGLQKLQEKYEIN
ncbi:MAG: hypothetical protein DRQ78_06085 [Epsilonproteobacteria bacterium]|nr:MAG: hypothetical protein DRQ78_06085 [Campylobacterota bacterium]